jgi:2-methylcitrate dehydratase PrpD
MNLTQKLAEEVVDANFSDIPHSAVTRIRDGILDGIGIAFLGYYKVGDLHVSYADRVGFGSPESTIIGDGSKVSCMVAAGVNASMGHSTDFFDGGPGYPSMASLAPSGVAVAERTGSSGRDLITAVAIGYEISARLHRAAFPLELIYGNIPKRDASFPGTDRQRALVIAIAASKLLGLDQSQTCSAMCIAWHYTPVPTTITKNGSFNLGSCHWGIQSTLLAQSGFDGPTDVLGNDTHYDHDRVLSSPSPYYYSSNELHLKPWISSRGVQPGIAATLDIMNENGITPDEIEAIRFYAKRLYLAYPFNVAEPKEYFEASNSVPWAFAMAILGYEAGPEWLDEDRLNDLKCIALSRKVDMGELPKATEIWESGVKNPNEATNEIEVLARGKVYNRSMTYGEAPGSSTNPMSPEWQVRKFKANSERVIGDKQSSELAGLLRTLEDQKDVREVTKLFKPAYDTI